jgi:hypothetical protein
MSADNGVYVLSTFRFFKKEGIARVSCAPHKVYRVAEAGAIDNWNWYMQDQPYNLGAYMQSIWGQSEVYDNKDDALIAAHKIEESLDICEYGVSVIDTNYVFYGDW